jgi:hypothetical protein
MRLTTVADLLYSLNSKLEIKAVPIDVDSIQEIFVVNVDDNWIPAKEFVVEESEYNELSKLEETKQLIQAA